MQEEKKFNIVFISNSRNHKWAGNVISEDEGIWWVNDWIQQNKFKSPISIDFEATGLDAYNLSPLLFGIGNQYIQFVIDCATINMKQLFLDPAATYIGQNIKYDLQIGIVHYSWKMRHIYDTMIAEQKIYQGCQSKLDFKYNLAAITERHLNKFRKHAKNTRNEFIGANPKTFVFTDSHIEYLAEDICDLELIQNSQMKYLRQYKLEWWMTNVEFPLTIHLAKCELHGFPFDSKAWQTIIDDNEREAHKYAVALDAELRKLRDEPFATERARLVGGIYDNPRQYQPRQLTMGLFGEMNETDFYKGMKGGKPKNITIKPNGTVKIATNTNNINWGSDQDILYILACLGQPAPLKGKMARTIPYLIPILRESAKKINRNIGRIPAGYVDAGKIVEISEGGYTTGKNEMTKYQIDFPNSPLKEFLILLRQWKECNHELDAFGKNFFTKLNKVTGKIHTTFRQANAVNSRFQSGGGDDEPDKYNAQNIPRKPKFRHCFLAEQDCSIVTSDLAGAEVTIICDKSNDKNLYEWAIKNDDSHSPMVQNVWRNIFLYRAGKVAKAFFSPTGFYSLHNNPKVLETLANSYDMRVHELYRLSQTFEVSKKVNKPYRQAGKNGTFGGLYGMKAAKAAEVFNGTDIELSKEDKNYTPVNVTKEEGSIILFAQRSAIPDTYAYVESNVQRAFSQGYIEYDNRSHSRIWFPKVIELFRAIEAEYAEIGNDSPQIAYLGEGKYIVLDDNQEYSLDYMDIKDIDGQARNVPISGTQADCIKEAIVDIMSAVEADPREHLTKHIKWLSQVHDELVIQCPKSMDGQSDEWHRYKNTIPFVFDKPVEREKFDDNPQVELIYTNTLGLVGSVHVSFPLFVKLTMIQAANRHMTNVQMGAEYEVKPYWTK